MAEQPLSHHWDIINQDSFLQTCRLVERLLVFAAQGKLFGAGKQRLKDGSSKNCWVENCVGPFYQRFTLY